MYVNAWYMDVYLHGTILNNNNNNISIITIKCFTKFNEHKPK